MPCPVIIDAVRSPMGRGRPGGALSSVHPVELLAALLRAVVQRHRLDPGVIDDVIIGCVSQSGEQAVTPARMALLAAGFPEHVPGCTIDRRCGSGQQAIHFAAHGIAAGAYDVVIAGGVESMSRVLMGSARMGQDPFGPSVQTRYAPGLIGQGISAELVAAKWKLSRSGLDEYAARSHRRAAAASDAGQFTGETVPIATASGTVEKDETIRETSTAQLALLKPSFVDEAAIARFGPLDFRITAGNASQITDGASVVLMASESAAARLGLRPRARFVAFDVCGSDPLLMLTGPIASTQRVLRKAGLSLDDIAHFEVNEAFASVPMAWQRELGVDDDRLNPLGGAIALGHPLGASGARLMTTMLHALERSGGRYGLQTMCENGGMANATVIERI